MTEVAALVVETFVFNGSLRKYSEKHFRGRYSTFTQRTVGGCTQKTESVYIHDGLLQIKLPDALN